MATYVVDATVFVRWFIDQAGYEHAREVRNRFLAGDDGLVAPDFVRVELSNVLRKKAYVPGLLTREELLSACRALDDLDVDLRPLDADAIERAAGLAADRSMSIYDAVYADLALTLGLPLLTGDARSARAVAGVVPTVVLRGIDP